MKTFIQNDGKIKPDQTTDETSLAHNNKIEMLDKEIGGMGKWSAINRKTDCNVQCTAKTKMPYSVHNLDSFVDFLYLFVCCIDGTNPKYNSWPRFLVTLSNLLNVQKQRHTHTHKSPPPKSMCMYASNYK